MNKINIMTSCDDTLSLYILPQIASIAKNIEGALINFYLFHSRISREHINIIKEYIKTHSNISFHEIVIKETEPYMLLAKHGGIWAYEAYYHLVCHEYLPEDIDRILYIDAGDVIINGKIEEYYFSDFEGKAIIGTHERLKTDASGNRFPYEETDRNNMEHLKCILRGAINSGSFVINLDKYRGLRLTIHDFVNTSKYLYELLSNERRAYFGDQGLISYVFVGDIKYFGHPEHMTIRYMPYDFGLWYFDKEPELTYTPMIIHFTGAKYRPWSILLTAQEAEQIFRLNPDKNIELLGMRYEQVKYFEIWWEYCKETPVYELIKRDARDFALCIVEKIMAQQIS